MKRQYARRFDWDLARQRYADGEQILAIANDMSVSDTAIRRVVVPGEYERMSAVRARWEATGSCPECGGKMSRAALSNGSPRCRRCANLVRATTVRPDMLQCVRCKQWKSDSEFPHNKAGRKLRRGRHSLCRVCQTLAKRDYRARQRNGA